MPESLTASHWVGANIGMILALALAHVAAMVLVGLAIWNALRYRAPLHEEFLASEPPHEHPRQGETPGGTAG